MDAASTHQYLSLCGCFLSSDFSSYLQFIHEYIEKYYT